MSEPFIPNRGVFAELVQSSEEDAASLDVFKANRLEAMRQQVEDSKLAAKESVALLLREIEDDCFQEAASRARGLANMLTGLNATLNAIADAES